MRQKVIFLVAFLSISVGLFGLFESHFSNQTVQVEAPQPQEKKILVWVIKNPLKKGEEITGSKVVQKYISETKAKKSDVFNDINIVIEKGDVVTKDFNSGDYIFQNDIINKNSPDYIDLILKPGMVPYPFETNISTVYGGVIAAGDYIDIVSLTSLEQNFAETERVDSYRSVSVSPLLTAVRILAVEDVDESVDRNQVTLVLELDRNDIARMVIAKRISQLEVHKSAFGKSIHKANTGDVLPDFFSVTELRGKERIVN